jgi:hypothetical protein
MKMPSAWTNAGKSQSKTTTTATKVQARIDMSAEVAGQGLCPDCKKPMQVVTAGPVETHTCMDCRIALPLPDDLPGREVPAVESQSFVNP